MPKSQKTDVSKASQERLAHALLESAPDAMVVADRYGTIVMVNKQTEQLFGYQRDELVGKTLQVLVPARFREQHSRHVEKFVACPSVRPMGAGPELFALRKDTVEIPVDISLRILLHDAQVGMATDGGIYPAPFRGTVYSHSLSGLWRKTLSRIPSQVVLTVKINYYLSELFRLFPFRNSRHDLFTAIKIARHLFLLN